MEWHGYTATDLALRSYIEHHGVKGQKWGIRRYQNPDGSLTEKGKNKVLKMYQKIEKTYDRMITKSDKYAANAKKKGKTGKEKTWNYASEMNRKAKAERLSKLGNMTYQEFKKSKSKDRFLGLYSQRFMDRNSSAIDMTSKITRWNERYNQFGNRIQSWTTFNKVLDTMSGEEGYRYLNTKRTYKKGVKKGRS